MARVADIPVGSQVEGIGVGREVYVTAKNVSAGTLQLSLALLGAGHGAELHLPAVQVRARILQVHEAVPADMA